MSKQHKQDETRDAVRHDQRQRDLVHRGGDPRLLDDRSAEDDEEDKVEVALSVVEDVVGD